MMKKEGFYHNISKVVSPEKIGHAEELKSLSDAENNHPTVLPYPKQVFFIIGNEFCERFNYLGMQAVLMLYLKNKLGYTPKDATVLFHTFTMCVLFMCIFGGILSDVWLGKFKTILYLSMIYAIGSIVIAVGAIPVVDISAKATLFVGLLLIALGSGGIKPCVSAFGGDQFKLPEQTAQFATFFSLFYFSINLGSVITTAVTPVLRQNVHCFGEQDCYSLAFGLPAALMIISIGFFLIGRPTYIYVKTSSENMVFLIIKCIWNAITSKFREKHTIPRKNLLDYSIDKFGHQLVNDIRILSKILVLYVPLPLFWTLFEQKGSRWILQAEQMNGDVGFRVILPDQMLMINPLLVLVFIPLFDALIYPLLSKIGIRRPLQKLTLGGICAGIAFLISAFVQFQIESSPENSINMLWQIPQYVILTMGEVIFAVTGLSFSYEQAPESMKSVVTSFWQITMGIGNFIIIILAESLEELFRDKQSYELLLYAILMLLDMVLFVVLALRYKSSTASKIDFEFESKKPNISSSTSDEKTTFI